MRKILFALLLLEFCFALPEIEDSAVDTSVLLMDKSRPPVVISWVGDIHLGQSVGELGILRGMDYVLADVRDSLLADSLTVGNLECSVSRSGQPEQGKEYTFQASPALLPGLRTNGIEFLSLANNHSLDFGKQAMLEMLEHLRAAGLLFGGAGADITAAATPVYVSIGGHRVAVLCFSRVVPAGWQAGRATPGIAGCLDPWLLLQRITETRDSADLVCVYLHWGKEKQTWPEDYVRALARRCIEAGADLVVGSHPHVLRGFEFYQGKLIAYSLGNFVFTNRDGRPSMILRTTFAGDSLVSATVIPCRIHMLRPELETDEAGRQVIFRSLSALSLNAMVDSTGAIRPPEPE